MNNSRSEMDRLAYEVTLLEGVQRTHEIFDRLTSASQVPDFIEALRRADPRTRVAMDVRGLYLFGIEELVFVNALAPHYFRRFGRTSDTVSTFIGVVLTHARKCKRLELYVLTWLVKDGHFTIGDIETLLLKLGNRYPKIHYPINRSSYLSYLVDVDEMRRIANQFDREIPGFRAYFTEDPSDYFETVENVLDPLVLEIVRNPLGFMDIFERLTADQVRRLVKRIWDNHLYIQDHAVFSRTERRDIFTVRIDDDTVEIFSWEFIKRLVPHYFRKFGRTSDVISTFNSIVLEHASGSQKVDPSSDLYPLILPLSALTKWVKYGYLTIENAKMLIQRLHSRGQNICIHRDDDTCYEDDSYLGREPGIREIELQLNREIRNFRSYFSEDPGDYFDNDNTGSDDNDSDSDDNSDDSDDNSDDSDDSDDSDNDSDDSDDNGSSQQETIQRRQQNNEGADNGSSQQETIRRRQQNIQDNLQQAIQRAQEPRAGNTQDLEQLIRKLKISLPSTTFSARKTTEKLRERKRRVMLFTESCKNGGETLLGVKWSQVPEKRWYRESSDGYCYDLEELLMHIETKLGRYQKPRFPWTNVTMTLKDLQTIVKTARKRGVKIPLTLDMMLFGISRGDIVYTKLKESVFDRFYERLQKAIVEAKKPKI